MTKFARLWKKGECCLCFERIASADGTSDDWTRNLVCWWPLGGEVVMHYVVPKFLGTVATYSMKQVGIETDQFNSINNYLPTGSITICKLPMNWFTIMQTKTQRQVWLTEAQKIPHNNLCKEVTPFTDRGAISWELAPKIIFCAPHCRNG